MDDALVARWRQGEGAAATAVRNALRTTAERVLSNPALLAAEGHGARALLENEERRRELTAAVAKEVMARGGDSAATLSALTLMSAARHAVEAIRHGRPMAGSAHLPPATAVAMALTPEVLPDAQREAYGRHLESCSACHEDCRLVKEAVRSAATVSHDATPAAIDVAVHEHAGEAMEAAAQAALEEMERRAPRPEPARPGGAPGRPAPRRQLETAPPRSSWTRALLPLLVLGGTGAWWVSSQRRAERLATVDPSVAALADRAAPPVGAAATLPEYARAGASLLAAGDCRTAGARFRAARRSQPEDRRLWLLEGGSFVCAGDGAAALQSLELLARDREATPEARWYHAQALLLTGSAGRAAEALEELSGGDDPYAQRAREQLEQVRAALP